MKGPAIRRRRTRGVAALFALAAGALLASAGDASAQIIYEPVRYQYSAFGEKFYYGGSDPHQIANGYRQAFFDRYVRYGRHPFNGRGFGGNERFNKISSVYTDLIPYVDASNYGFTPNDARNEAIGRVPTYWRKSDLFRSVRVDPTDGTILVPSAPPGPAPFTAEVHDYRRGRGTIDIRPYVAGGEWRDGRDDRPATTRARPSTTRSTKILIIPKSNLRKATPDKQVAAAR